MMNLFYGLVVGMWLGIKYPNEVNEGYVLIIELTKLILSQIS